MQLFGLVTKRIQSNVGPAVAVGAPPDLSPLTGHLADETVEFPDVLLGVLQSTNLV